MYTIKQLYENHEHIILDLCTWTKLTTVIVDNHTYQQKIHNFVITNRFFALWKDRTKYAKNRYNKHFNKITSWLTNTE